MAARRSEWKTLPLPDNHQALAIERTYSAAEWAGLADGVVPRAMEDKWFVFFESPWLYLHRSWTGFCIYQIRFEANGDTHRISQALVNREPSQYTEVDDDKDLSRLGTLLDAYARRGLQGAASAS